MAQLIQCPHCGKMTDQKLDNCVHCGGILKKGTAAAGTRRSQTCPSCNALVQEGDIICVACGTNLLTGQKIADSKPAKPVKKEYEKPFPWVLTGIVAVGVIVILGGVGALLFVLLNNPVAKAERLHQQGRTLEAVELLMARTEKKPDDGRAQFALGGGQLSMGNYPAAARAFDQATRLLPARPQAAYLAGVCHAAESGGVGLDAAVTSLEEAVRRDSNNAEAHYLLGLAYARRGNIEGAATSFSNAVSAAPEHGQARLALGVVRALQGQLDVAQKELTLAQTALGDLPDTQVATGLVSGLQGATADALTQLTGAADAGTSVRAQALLQAGLLQLMQGNYSEARVRLQEASSLNPNDEGARFFLATIRDIEGLREEALGDYETLGRGTGLWAGEANAQAARLHLAGNEPGLALEAAARALEKGYTGALVHTIRGRVYMANGELEQARQALQQAVQTDGSFAPAHLETGLLNLMRNRYPEALQSLERYLELVDPALPDARYEEISGLVQQMHAAEGTAAATTMRSDS